MGVWLNAASVATALNVVLLLVLGSVWVRNYLKFRSKHTLGLSVFAALLLAENLLSLNYYVLDPQVAQLLSSADPIAGRAMMLVQVLELAAIVFLLWVTWD
jgi:beta-lactamase regulating signal transducer with metallopeptidase domain